MIQPVTDVLSRFIVQFIEFLPSFLGGLLIFILGIIIASILSRFFISLVSFFRLPNILERTRLVQKKEVTIWSQVIAEIIRWTVIILFLIPTLEAWGLSQATVVLNELLLYIPNVIIAVVIAFIGIVAANLVSDLVRQSIRSIGEYSARSFAFFSKSVVIFFTILIVLNQLGVAQNLIMILFTGIVAMIALAGGLAFGLGGQKIAAEILHDMQKNLKKTTHEATHSEDHRKKE
ncbi:MAG: mechanosensitive ion channel family protein [Patescibacteria group bacterium]